MNINSFTFRIVVLIFLLGTASSHAVVFTNNTSIGALDASYDGADIVISNCTVTLDGAHGFNSVLVANGGVLTHTFYPNGSTTFLVGVGNEAIVLSSTNPAVLLHTNVASIATVTDLAQVTTYANNVDYVIAPQPDGTTQLWWTNTSAIADGATVLVNYTWAYNVMAGLNVTVTNDFTVAIGGSVNATGNGYGGGLGSGHGFTAASSFADGSGAGYGGNGGNSSSNAVGGAGYGSLTQPNLPGSGGGASYLGSGGHGGGLVQIVAGRNVMVDGAILANGANGTNSRAGGGAGGSIWITAPNLTGAGTLTANGGAGEPVHGGGGGGGRIAIQCGTNYFTGTLTTYGGSGAKIGGAGTIFLQVTNQNGFLLVDNGGRAGNYSTVILPALTDVLIRSNATVFPSGAWSAGNVTIGKAGTLAQATLNLNVTGTLAVQTGGAISADGLGYTSGSGPGAGRFYSASPFYPCSGAGHGGNGALGSPTNINANAGGTYGSQTSLNSSDFGSGGGTYATFSFGGNGGGFLNLSVNGALQVDGTISANGTSGFGTGGGGGSGGGIAITATTLTGNGAILANGGSGAGTAGGGGGGGRITVNSVSNLFSGTLLAAGGGGANYGGAGTIYLQRPSVSSYQLILDNGGHAGTNTPVSSASTASLIVRNGAVGSANFSASFAGLNIFSNSWLASIGQTVPSTLTLAISGDATIQAGGGIIGDSFGYTATTGISGGAGGQSSIYSPYGGNGAGHATQGAAG